MIYAYVPPEEPLWAVATDAVDDANNITKIRITDIEFIFLIFFAFSLYLIL